MATTLIDDYSPRSVNDTANPLMVQFTDRLGKVYDLSTVGTSDITLKLQDINGSNVIVGGGTWTITDAVNGIAQYAWITGDVAIAGSYKIIVRVNFAGKPLTFSNKTLEIDYLP